MCDFSITQYGRLFDRFQYFCVRKRWETSMLTCQTSITDALKTSMETSMFPHLCYFDRRSPRLCPLAPLSLLFRFYPSVSFSGVCFRFSVCSVFAFFSVPRVARTRSNNKIKSQGASCSVFGVDVDAAQTQQRQSNGKCRQACASCARLQVFVFVSPCYCANHPISTNKQTVNKLKDILINNYRIYKPSLKANTIHNY